MPLLISGKSKGIKNKSEQSWFNLFTEILWHWEKNVHANKTMKNILEKIGSDIFLQSHYHQSTLEIWKVRKLRSFDRRLLGSELLKHPASIKPSNQPFFIWFWPGQLHREVARLGDPYGTRELKVEHGLSTSPKPNTTCIFIRILWRFDLRSWSREG